MHLKQISVSNTRCIRTTLMDRNVYTLEITVHSCRADKLGPDDAMFRQKSADHAIVPRCRYPVRRPTTSTDSPIFASRYNPFFNPF
jgi:hypothetical protein